MPAEPSPADDRISKGAAATDGSNVIPTVAAPEQDTHLDPNTTDDSTLPQGAAQDKQLLLLSLHQLLLRSEGLPFADAPPDPAAASSQQSEAERAGAAEEDRHNFADARDGAKLVAANKEARKAAAVLDSDGDTFLKNECKADKWVLVELSQVAKVEEVQISQASRRHAVDWLRKPCDPLGRGPDADTGCCSLSCTRPVCMPLS